MTTQKNYHILKNFFEYITYAVFPNITLYVIQDTLPVKTEYDVHSLFTRDNVHEYIWAHRHNNKYYALLKLTNGYYLYLRGYLDFNIDKFTFYIGKSLDEIIPFMSRKSYSKYIDNLTNHYIPSDTKSIS